MSPRCHGCLPGPPKFAWVPALSLALWREINTGCNSEKRHLCERSIVLSPLSVWNDLHILPAWEDGWRGSWATEGAKYLPNLTISASISISGTFLVAESLKNLPAMQETQADPIDGSPPGSPVPGILQARTLEWVAISFSNALRGSLRSYLRSLA